MPLSSSSLETDVLIDTFLEGAPRAQTWASLRQTLESRLEAVRQEHDAAAPAERGRLAKKLKDLEQQVRALREEEAITQFVEDTIRATVARPHPLEVETDG